VPLYLARSSAPSRRGTQFHGFERGNALRNLPSLGERSLDVVHGGLQKGDGAQEKPESAPDNRLVQTFLGG
jgi:hypothetical protein